MSLALYAVLPGIGQEFSPAPGLPPYVRTALQAPPASTFAQPEIPYEHAAGPLTVLLLALVLVTLAVRGVHCQEVWQLLGLLLCLGCGVLLLATRWESDVAVASAVRWLMSGLVLAGSLALWGQGSITHWLARIGLHAGNKQTGEATAVLIRRMLLGMATVTAVGLLMAMTGGFETPRLAGTMFDISAVTGVLIVMILGGTLLSRWSLVVGTRNFAKRSQRQSKHGGV